MISPSENHAANTTGVDSCSAFVRKERSRFHKRTTRERKEKRGEGQPFLTFSVFLYKSHLKIFVSRLEISNNDTGPCPFNQ